MFNFAEGGNILNPDVLAQALLTLEQGRIRLPYPECIFMYWTPGVHIGNAIRSVSAGSSRLSRPTRGQIIGNLFYHHPARMAHWGVNTSQFSCLPDGTIEIATDPTARLDPQHLAIIERSAQDRARAVVCHAMRLAEPSAGTITMEPTGSEPTPANQ